MPKQDKNTKIEKPSKIEKPTKVEKTNTEESTSEANKKTNIKVYRYKDIKVSKIDVSEINKDGQQPVAYINYNISDGTQSKILLQTGKIKLTAHGIPSLTDENSKYGNYRPTDDKREFMKVPLDPDQAACNELKAHAKEIDEWCGSAEIRKKLFGKNADKYEYQPIVRTPMTMDNDDDDDNEDSESKSKKNSKKKGGDKSAPKPKIDFIKMRFNVAVDGKNRVNKTKLTKLEGDKKKIVKASTITEIANEIQFRSEVRLVFYYTKIWINKAALPGGTKRLYGIGLKIMAVEYTPSTGKGVDPEAIEFMSEEEDGGEKNEVVEAKTKSKSQKAPKMDSDDEDNDADKGDEEEEKDDDKDDDKDEDEEEDNSKKSKKKSSKSKKNDDDDEDNEEDDTSNKKDSKKKSKSKSKSKQEDDENDDENEETIKPKKKSSKSKNTN